VPGETRKNSNVTWETLYVEQSDPALLR